MNLPQACVELAMGKKPSIASDYQVGALFVRISIDRSRGSKTSKTW